jgi:hypothetical protein
MRKIITFENEPVITPLSPIFKHCILETTIEDLEYIKKLEEFILFNEPHIIANLPATTDGATGLGNNSLTSRFASINFFKCSEFNYLKQIVKYEIQEYLNYIGFAQFDEPLYGQCWANVMRPGDQILKHQHGNGSNTFLSGNLIVKTSGSHTCFYNRYNTNDKYISENLVGNLTVFPDFLEHDTSKVETDIRVTIAFDIITEKMTNLISDSKLHEYQKEHWVQI